MTRMRLLPTAIAIIAVACGAESPPDAEIVAADSLPSLAPTPEPPPGDPLAEMRRVADAGRIERMYHLLLVNNGPESLVIRAEAGAGDVAVDSVAAGDSVRVDLAVRSDSVTLLAGRPGAVALRRTLRYPADSTRRIELTP